MVASPVESKLGMNPFVGPRSFQTGEHLYGRARESVELVDLIIAERIVLLYSPSGAGKSSLINAVVVPQMKKEEFMLPPVLRINMEPPADCKNLPEFNRYTYSMLRSLEDSLPAEKQYAAGQLAAMTLEQYMADYRKRAAGSLENYDEKGSMLLIIDQFEEILRLNISDQAAKQAFFAQLGELLRHDRALWALIAIREDYLAALQPYVRPVPNRLSVTYRLDFLDAASAIDAIQGPSRDSGVEFQDAAARLLVENLRSIRVQQADGSTVEEAGPYVEPVQLQVVCNRLWEKAATRGVVTVDDVKDAGNIDDALSEYYSEHVTEAVAASGVSERQIREWFDRKLITPSAIRGQVLMEPENSGGLSNKAIKFLQEAYLVRAEKRGNAVWFELAHDRLTRPIRQNNSDWFIRHLSVFQRQADFWNLQGKPDSLILGDQAYLEAEEWVKQNPQVLEQPGPEKEFLEVCRQKYRTVVRERRLNNIVRWAALGMFILAILAGISFWRATQAEKVALEKQKVAVDAQAEAVAAQQDALAAKQQADSRKNEADVRGLVAQSATNLSIDPSVSIALALQAEKTVADKLPDDIDLARDVEDALRKALPMNRLELVLHDPALDANSLVSHQGTVWSAAFDVNAENVATAGAEGTIKLWNRVSGASLQQISIPHPGAPAVGVTFVEFSPDGKTLAAATDDGRVLFYAYDGKGLKQTKSLKLNDAAIWSLAFSSDSTRLAMGGLGGFAQIIYMDDHSQPVIFPRLEGDVHAVAFDLKGTYLATGDSTGQVFLWDSRTAQKQPRSPGQAHSGAIGGLAFNPVTGALATSGADDRIIKLWDAADPSKMTLSITGHRDGINAIVFTPDGKNLISASADRTIRFWDTSYGRPGIILYGHTDQVYGLALGARGGLVVSTSKDRTARIWNISPQGSREYDTFDIGTPIHDIAISPDGSTIVLAREDHFIDLMNVKTGGLLHSLSGHVKSVDTVAFSPDGKELMSGGQDGQAIIWGLPSGKVLQTLQGQHGRIMDVAFSPDGKRVAAAAEDGTVEIWNGTTGKSEMELPSDPKAGSALSIAYSPDGNRLAAGYAGSQILLWNTKTWKSDKVLEGHTDAVRALTFKPDGSMLVSGGDDGAMLLWDMNPKSLGELQAPLRDRGDAVLSLAYAAKGNFLFSGGADGIGTLWDMDLRQPHFNTYGQSDRIYAVAITPDGSFLFTAGRDGTLRQHVFDFDQLVHLASDRSTRQFTEEECRQFLNAACPADVALAIPAPQVLPGGPALNQPADMPGAPESTLKDPVLAGQIQTSPTRFDDNYYMNRFERPFNSDFSLYYPDVDIRDAAMSRVGSWMYFSITVKGPRGDGLLGNYAAELDMDGNGHGDFLITTLAPGQDWSTSGVRIWADKNWDVGGDQPFSPEAASPKLDGYETLVFDQGNGEQKDLAWSRLSPKDPNTVQIAVLRSAVNFRKGDDAVFIWYAWASRDPFQPAWFNYNDHFTKEEAGSVVDKNGALSALKELAGLDSTCREIFGGERPDAEIYCK
jgi:WD40 repeat protein